MSIPPFLRPFGIPLGKRSGSSMLIIAVEREVIEEEESLDLSLNWAKRKASLRGETSP